MKQIPLVGTFLLLAAFSLPVMVGCKQEPKKDNPPPPVPNKDGTAAIDYDGALKGVIVGTVKFDGDAPKAEYDTRIGESKEKAMCEAGPAKHKNKQDWLVKDGNVENVIVSLKPKDGFKFKIDDALKTKYKKTVELDQPFCNYAPRVIGVYADVQDLLVKNSAKVVHNTVIKGNDKINGKKDSGNIPAGESFKVGVLKMEREPMTVSCSMHGWMTGSVVTFDHPYFAVTGEDGKFRIENVPVGAELSVVYWHEQTKERVHAAAHTVTEGDNKIEIKIKN